MSFPITIRCEGGEYLESLLNEEIDCSPGYEVCLNTILFTAGAWANISDGNWIQVKLNDHLYDKVYIPSKDYTSKSDLLSIINDELQLTFGRSTFRVYPYGENKKQRWFINKSDYLKFKHIVKDRDIIYQDYVRDRPLQPPHWSLEEDMDLFYNEGGMFVYKDTEKSLENIHHLLNLGKQWDLATFKMLFEYIRPGRDLDIESLFSADATLQWIAFDHYKKTEIILSPQIALLLGFIPNVSIPVPPMRHLTNPGLVTQINMNRNTLKCLYVFADFVMPTSIGPEEGTLIKIVPLLQNTGDVNHTVFENVSFVPVQRRRIQQVRFYVKESLSAKSNITFKQPVLMVLLFQSINDDW